MLHVFLNILGLTIFNQFVTHHNIERIKRLNRFREISKPLLHINGAFLLKFLENIQYLINDIK